MKNYLWIFCCFFIIYKEKVFCQTLCGLLNSSNITTSDTNSVYLNNFSTDKCLRIENFGHYANSKIFLDECFWGKTLLTKDENFYLKNSTFLSDGLNIVNDGGLNEKYCMSTKDGVLQTSQCRQNAFEQVWRIKPVRNQPNYFQIQQVSSSKCAIPRGRTSRSLILLAPCNSYQTEQLWKVCMTF